MDLVKDYWTTAFGADTPAGRCGRATARRSRPRTRSGATRCTTASSHGTLDRSAARARSAAAAGRRLRPRSGCRPRQTGTRDRLPSRSAHPRRPLRQQRLAAGVAEAALEGHVGQRRVHRARRRRAHGIPVFRRQRRPVIDVTLSGPARSTMPVWVHARARPTTSVVVHFGYGRRKRRPRRHRRRRRHVRAAHVAGAVVRRRRGDRADRRDATRSRPRRTTS